MTKNANCGSIPVHIDHKTISVLVELKVCKCSHSIFLTRQQGLKSEWEVLVYLHAVKRMRGFVHSNLASRLNKMYSAQQKLVEGANVLINHKKQKPCRHLSPLRRILSDRRCVKNLIE